jgi:hypothetical protein
MPKVIFTSHIYTCKLCQWRKEADKRTLSHAVKLHTRLVHNSKVGDLGFKDTMTVSKPLDAKQIYYNDKVQVVKITDKTL